jgi:NADH:ubiquinone oxidoreductase subunit 5 (subunit L)/multisubunit Na+/H+ antiporter MnhA subunit
MEGPTPSSAVFYGAVMIHAGVYLLILLQPLFEHAPLVMLLLAGVGLLTAVYSFTVGLTQTDVKSSLAFATSGQLGLMFLECGLGFWQLASWHLCAHAVVRGYSFLTAPSLMHAVHAQPITPVLPVIAGKRWLYTASLQRFWLDAITDWAVVKPIYRLAQDMSYFDEAVIDRLMGAPKPVIRNLSAYAHYKEQHIGAQLDNDTDEFAKGSGLAGILTQWTANMLDWFEQRFILRSNGSQHVDYGRQLGHAANRFEQLILRPRYLLLFVGITLLLAF